MATDVSIKPRVRGSSATRLDSLVDQLIQVGSKSPVINRGYAPECLNYCLSRNKTSPAQGQELAHSHAIPRDYERLARIEAAHNLAAAIPKGSLGNLVCHQALV